MSEPVELYYIDGVPSAENITNDSPTGVSSTSAQVQPAVEVSADQKAFNLLSSRLETLEKKHNELSEKAVRTDSDAKLNSLDIKERLTAYWGKIAGWVMENGILSTPTMSIDSNNQCIQSANYSPGNKGFKISQDLVEAENIVARGTLKGTTFAYDQVSAVGGQLMIANADTLELDMNALDSCKLETKGDTTFAVNDILLMRGVATSGIQEEWFRVTAVSGTTYTVTRDIKAEFGANENPAWKAGTPVVKQGSSDGATTYSGGWLKLYGEGTNAPYYSVYKRTGVAYNASTEYVRLGNLNGFIDYATDIYGIGIGDATRYLKFDPTNGLRIVGTVEAINYYTAGIALTAGQAVCIHTDGKAYSTDAVVSTMTTPFIGFCTVTTAKDGSAPIITVGSSKNQSSLTIASNYYASDATHAVDQQYTSGGSWIDVSDASENQYIAFTVGNGITHISSFACAFDRGANPSTVTMRLRTGTGLGGTLLGTAVTGDVSGSGYDMAYFASPIPVTAGQTYSVGIQASRPDVDIQYNPTGSLYNYKSYYTTGRGAIGTSAGTTSKKVGLALSATELLIINS